jgi:hypothetical protein
MHIAIVQSRNEGAPVEDHLCPADMLAERLERPLCDPAVDGLDPLVGNT